MVSIVYIYIYIYIQILSTLILRNFVYIYKFFFSKSINIAWNKLNIKNQPSDVANQRLLLFRVAKMILAQGMKLLGLTPLEKM